MGASESNHNYNLFYGLQNGKLKHISEVTNGLNCNCICPACEKKLVARNGGKKRIHHFAHYESATCRYGAQTSIHIAAKEVLEKVKNIKVPSYWEFINTGIEKTDYNFISHGDFVKIIHDFDIPIDRVVLEKRLHKYIPDVVVFSNNKRLVIEIAVTHFVGRKKLEEIKASKVSAIEIDLSKIKPDCDFSDLETLIIENLENKKWLYNHYGRRQALVKRAEIIRLFEIDKEKERKQREHCEIKERKQRKQREQREIWYREFYKPVIRRKDEYNNTFLEIDNCPAHKRVHNGRYYAIVKKDCIKCTHSRWLREYDKYLICLFDYHKEKQID